MLKLNQDELEKLYTDGKEMIWNYRTLYQIMPKNKANNQFYLVKVTQLMKGTMGVTLRGRYIPMTAEVARSYN